MKINEVCIILHIEREMIRMPQIRKPTQKRSIEKQNKIIHAGFELFCEKGYYETNTNEICKRAGVSTGALYSYFPDKKAIFISAFQKFFEEQIDPLLFSLSEGDEPFTVDEFIEKTICVFTIIYANSSSGIAELSNMMNKDEEIFQTFCGLEEKLMNVFIDTLVQNNINASLEKLYLIYAMIDAIAQENNINAHSEMDSNKLLQAGINAIKGLLEIV